MLWCMQVEGVCSGKHGYVIAVLMIEHISPVGCMLLGLQWHVRTVCW